MRFIIFSRFNKSHNQNFLYFQSRPMVFQVSDDGTKAVLVAVSRSHVPGVHRISMSNLYTGLKNLPDTFNKTVKSNSSSSTNYFHYVAEDEINNLTGYTNRPNFTTHTIEIRNLPGLLNSMREKMNVRDIDATAYVDVAQQYTLNVQQLQQDLGLADNYFPASSAQARNNNTSSQSAVPTITIPSTVAVNNSIQDILNQNPDAEIVINGFRGLKWKKKEISGKSIPCLESVQTQPLPEQVIFAYKQKLVGKAYPETVSETDQYAEDMNILFDNASSNTIVCSARILEKFGITQVAHTNQSAPTIVSSSQQTITQLPPALPIPFISRPTTTPSSVQRPVVASGSGNPGMQLVRMIGRTNGNLSVVQQVNVPMELLLISSGGMAQLLQATQINTEQKKLEFINQLNDIIDNTQKVFPNISEENFSEYSAIVTDEMRNLIKKFNTTNKAHPYIYKFLLGDGESLQAYVLPSQLQVAMVGSKEAIAKLKEIIRVNCDKDAEKTCFEQRLYGNNIAFGMPLSLVIKLRQNTGSAYCSLIMAKSFLNEYEEKQKELINPTLSQQLVESYRELVFDPLIETVKEHLSDENKVLDNKRYNDFLHWVMVAASDPKILAKKKAFINQELKITDAKAEKDIDLTITKFCDFLRGKHPSGMDKIGESNSTAGLISITIKYLSDERLQAQKPNSSPEQDNLQDYLNQSMQEAETLRQANEQLQARLDRLEQYIRETSGVDPDEIVMSGFEPTMPEVRSFQGKMPGKDEAQTFYEKFVDPDGDCGYRGCETTRKEVKEVILSLADNENDRLYLQDEIFTAFKGDDFALPPAGQSLRRLYFQEHEKFDELFRELRNSVPSPINELEIDEFVVWLAQNDRQKDAELLTTTKSDLADLESEIKDYCKNKEMYIAYANALGDKLWLGYKSALLFAKHTGFNLYIWDKNQNDASKVELIDHHECSNPSKTIHLLHTSGYTHFNLLIDHPYHLELQNQADSSQKDEEEMESDDDKEITTSSSGENNKRKNEQSSDDEDLIENKRVKLNAKGYRETAGITLFRHGTQPATRPNNNQQSASLLPGQKRGSTG